jgi:hypothetical protein
VWKKETWAFGIHDGRLGWNGKDIQPSLVVENVSFAQFVPTADKKKVRKAKSVSITRRKVEEVEFIGSVSASTPTTRTNIRNSINPDSFREFESN